VADGFEFGLGIIAAFFVVFVVVPLVLLWGGTAIEITVYLGAQLISAVVGGIARFFRHLVFTILGAFEASVDVLASAISRVVDFVGLLRRRPPPDAASLSAPPKPKRSEWSEWHRANEADPPQQ
jgi:hypothetical protein